MEETEDSLRAGQTLWVDKYAPKSFSQLLSAEKTNREVLKALKLWDPYVFKTGGTGGTAGGTVGGTATGVGGGLGMNQGSHKPHDQDPSVAMSVNHDGDSDNDDDHGNDMDHDGKILPSQPLLVLPPLDTR